MTEIKRKIEKENGKYVFVTETDEVVRKEYVSKETFKKNYEEVKAHRNKRRDELAAVNKRLKTIDVTKDDELEKFINLANKASQYNNMKKAEEEHDNVLNLLSLLDQQVSDMEKAMPELTRKK